MLTINHNNLQQSLLRYIGLEGLFKCGQELLTHYSAQY